MRIGIRERKALRFMHLDRSQRTEIFKKREWKIFVDVVVIAIFQQNTRHFVSSTLSNLLYSKKKGVNISRKYRKSLGNIPVRGAKLNLSI